MQPQGLSPPHHQPRPTVGHGWGLQGTRWPSSRISPQLGITVGAQGSRFPQGMNYRAINHARLSRRVLCPSSIRRHKQLCSQQDWQKARQKWVHRDPGDLWGGPGQGGRARHLGTPRPPCPRSVKHCDAGDVVATPLLPVKPLSAPGKGPGGGDGCGVPVAGLPPVLVKPLSFNLKKCQQARQLPGWEVLELVPVCPTLPGSKI